MANPTPDVMAVFDRAAEIEDPADREAYLAEACTGAPDVRRKVDALLRADARAGSFLDEPAVLPADPALVGRTETADQPQPAVAAGTVVAGRYKLLQELGKGGMGSVFMADQTSPVKRRVAVKVIKAGMDSAQVLARFEAERQALALMDHPNIAKVLDAEAMDTGRPFFVMELVKGVPLTQYCDEHRLPVPERLGLFMQICGAVQHAHQKGIIHRDLKPANILVESHDGKPVPKVIDFGLAKATGGLPLTEHTLFTALGTVAGTPLYMAPEQAAFNAIDVDTRADIYALGVILYELLTGTTPIERETFKTAAFDELMRMVREQDPVTPSTRLSSSGSKASVAASRQTEPAKLGRFVRGELDWIVMKALAKERNRRYESATAFAQDVGRFLNHEAVAAGPPGAGYRARKFARRNRGLLTAAALVAAALVAGSGVSTWQAVQATRARADADRERVRAEENFASAMGAVDQMLTRVGEKRLAVVPQMEEERRRLLEDALQFYRKFLEHGERDNPQVLQEAARAYQRTARIHQLLGNPGQAQADYAAALKIQQDLAARFPDRPAYRLDQAVSYRGLGGLLRFGQPGPAEAAYRQAIDLLDPLVKANPDASDLRRELGATYDGLGQLHLATGRLEPEATEAFGQALSIRKSLAERTPADADVQTDLARTHVNLGLLYRDRGEKRPAHENLTEARRIWNGMVARRTEEAPEYQSELALVDEMLGLLHRENGEGGPAEKALQSTLQIRSGLATKHPLVIEYQNDLARTHNGLCELYRLLGDNRKADDHVEKARSILEPLYRRYPDEFTFNISLGVTYAEKAAVLRMVADGLKDDLQQRATLWESVEWCGRSIDCLKGAREKDALHAEAQKVQSNAHMARAEAYVKLERPADAIMDWESMAELGVGQTHAELLSLRALGLAHLGRHAEATDVVQDMRDKGREPVYSLYNFVCVFSLSMQAAQGDPTLSAAGRIRRAEQYAARAFELLAKMKAEGFFRNPGFLEYMKADSDMKPLEARPDYRAFVQELQRDAPPARK